jgi:hypothetical protein
MASTSEPSHPGSLPLSVLHRSRRSSVCRSHRVVIPDRRRALRLRRRPGNRVGSAHGSGWGVRTTPAGEGAWLTTRLAELCPSPKTRFPGAMASGSEPSHPGSFPVAAQHRPGRSRVCTSARVRVPDRRRALRLRRRPGNQGRGWACLRVGSAHYYRHSWQAFAHNSQPLSPERRRGRRRLAGLPIGCGWRVCCKCGRLSASDPRRAGLARGVERVKHLGR